MVSVSSSSNTPCSVQNTSRRRRRAWAISHAVSAHYTRWEVPHDSALDKALLACDELTGFVVACSLVRPEGITTLAPKSVRKKLKDKAFAAKVERYECEAGPKLLGVEMDSHIQMVIDALKPHAAELGLGGRSDAPAG